MHAACRLHVPPEAALPLEKAGALVAGKTSAAAESGRGEELYRAAFPGPSPCRRGGEPAPLPPMKGGPAESGSPTTNPARLRWGAANVGWIVPERPWRKGPSRLRR